MKEENIMIFAIVPSELYRTKKLTSEEKLIAERISALCHNSGYAWITNKALTNMYGIREDTVSKHIKKLERYGYIRCSYIKSEHKSRRTIYLAKDILEEYTLNNSINIKKGKDYLSGHNNKYNYKNNNNRISVGPIFGKDKDGVDTWNGERIEFKPASKEEQAELKRMIEESCYHGDDNE